MGQYRFVTDWRVEALPERVWAEVFDSESWPDWWHGVLAVKRVGASEADGEGDEVRRYTFRGRLPYSLSFDMRVSRSEPPILLVGRATGELEGVGTWTLKERDGGTDVRYVWEVRTTKKWMDLPFPFARRIFVANHDAIMRWGAEGLAKRLGVQVVDLSGHAPAEPGTA